MIMSSFFGRRRDKFDNDSDFKYCSFRMARELQEYFMQTYGSVICKDIHSKLFGRTYNLLDPVDKEQFDTDGAHTDKCTSVVANAASWTTSIILKEAGSRGLEIRDLAVT